MAENKTLRVQKHPSSMFFEVRWNDGGQLPKELSGLFTSTATAQVAIDRYMNKKSTNANSRSKDSSK